MDPFDRRGKSQNGSTLQFSIPEPVAEASCGENEELMTAEVALSPDPKLNSAGASGFEQKSADGEFRPVDGDQARGNRTTLTEAVTEAEPEAPEEDVSAAFAIEDVIHARANDDSAASVAERRKLRAFERREINRTKRMNQEKESVSQSNRKDKEISSEQPTGISSQRLDQDTEPGKVCPDSDSLRIACQDEATSVSHAPVSGHGSEKDDMIKERYKAAMLASQDDTV